MTDAVASGWVSSVGEYVVKFENAISSYTKSGGAIACQSGTSGLHLALIALGVKKDDEVIISTLSFIASVNPIKYIGAHPIFVDCDDSLCIDADKVE